MGLPTCLRDPLRTPQAAILGGRADALLENMLLLDAYPLAVCVGGPGGAGELAIPASTIVPTKKEVELLVEDTQQGVLSLTVSAAAPRLQTRPRCCRDLSAPLPSLPRRSSPRDHAPVEAALFAPPSPGLRAIQPHPRRQHFSRNL